jgi:hypothetical protein
MLKQKIPEGCRSNRCTAYEGELAAEGVDVNRHQALVVQKQEHGFETITDPYPLFCWACGGTIAHAAQQRRQDISMRSHDFARKLTSYVGSFSSFEPC